MTFAVHLFPYNLDRIQQINYSVTNVFRVFICDDMCMKLSTEVLREKPKRYRRKTCVFPVSKRRGYHI